jgi:hypothetical protein
MRDVDRDVLRHQPVPRQPLDQLVILFLHPQRDRRKQAQLMHALHKRVAIELESVHHVEVVMFGHEFTQFGADHRLHVGRDYWDSELSAAQLYGGVALGAAFHPAFAGDQQDIFVIENLHHIIKALLNLT